MSTVDISQLGNLLNMKNVFSLYVNKRLGQKNKQAQNILSDLRKNLLQGIRHTSYQQVNQIMQQLVKRTSRYSVLTRISLEKALERAAPFKLLIASALYEDMGMDEALLYLLHPSVKTEYRGKQLLSRFGFIDSSEKNDSHE